MEQNKQPTSGQASSGLLWIISGILLLGLLVVRGVYPELLWLIAAVALPLILTLGMLIRQNHKALRTRSAAYGLNSAITVLLVIGIVGVLNFLASRHPMKADFTKNKLHTLSDQTVKVVKGLQQPVKAVFYAKAQQRDQFGALLDNYKSLNPKFELEYVDPDREPTRAKQSGIKKYGTLQLLVGPRETKVEEPTEEKITNSLIKLLKDKVPTLCAVTGHGEKNFNSQDAEGYSVVKKALSDQAYDVKDLNIIQEAKIPVTCDVIAIIGPTKAFFQPEIKAIKDYLDQGGRAIIAVDLNLKQGEYAPEINALLHDWYIKPQVALIVDPLSRMLGVDSSVAILASFSKENAISKDFQINCAFPFSRPLEILKGVPAGLKVQWIAQTTPKSWGVTDLSQLAKGQVAFNQGKDIAGPLTTTIAVEGKQKDSKATKNTRLVVFSTSQFATNNYSRFMGNLDFFLNSVSWTMEDESLISIRSKEDTAGKIELSQKTGVFVFLLTVLIIPILIAATGIGIWAVRRRL